MRIRLEQNLGEKMQKNDRITKTPFGEIEQENLLTEIKEALNDLFVAKINLNEKNIEMEFANGQKFRLRLEEIA